MHKVWTNWVHKYFIYVNAYCGVRIKCKLSSGVGVSYMVLVLTPCSQGHIHNYELDYICSNGNIHNYELYYICS